MKLAFKVKKPKLLKSDVLKTSFTELLGTFLFMFIIFLGPVMLNQSEPFIVMTAIISLMIVFGIFAKPHFNPIFSFALYFSSIFSQIKNKKFELNKLLDLLVLLISQFLGALLAFLLAKALLNSIVDYQMIINSESFAGIENVKEQLLERISFTTNTVGTLASTAFVLEMIFSAVLAFSYLATSSKENNQTQVAIVIGLLSFGFMVFVSSYTGSIFNPLRSFIPAIFAGGVYMAEAWIFILGPIVGALIASILNGLINILSKSKEIKNKK